MTKVDAVFIKPWDANSGLLLTHWMRVLPKVRRLNNLCQGEKDLLWTRKTPDVLCPLIAADVARPMGNSVTFMCPFLTQPSSNVPQVQH